MSTQFADEVKFEVKAGDGGNGAISFRREKFVAKGGPDGGDGGNGGSVVLVADHNENTLSDLARRKNYAAEPGTNGSKQKSSGKAGNDLLLKVPVGTQVFEMDPEKPKAKPVLMHDLAKAGDRYVVAKGGAGGFGNHRFSRPSFQTPRFAELGEPGEERMVLLKLKVLADVGVIGLPNVGKSTLLSVISNARPKIANYEFTTLVPNLGIVHMNDANFMVADIPGLIEGASKGKGLGFQFLRHVERTRLLVHVLDGTRPDVKKDFSGINKELASYDKQLAGRPQIIVINKIEMLDGPQFTKIKKIKFKDFPIFYISAQNHTGTKELVGEIAKTLQQLKKTEPAAALKTFTLADVINERFEVTKKGRKFTVTGPKQVRLLIKTDLENPESVGRMFKVLNRMGVLAELKKAGARPGDLVKIGKKEFEFESI